jgi:hypothetical protein
MLPHDPTWQFQRSVWRWWRERFWANIGSYSASQDAIELRSLFSTSLPFDGILGPREYAARGAQSGRIHYLNWEPNDDGLPTLDFQKSYNFDAVFYEWFNKLLDLDAMDKVKRKGSDFGLA